MEAVVLDRVGFLAYFCPKQGQDFKPSAAPLYPNVGQVPPPGTTLTKVTYEKYATRVPDEVAYGNYEWFSSQ